MDWTVGVSNLRVNWSYITPIMVSCPIKSPEHVVQEAEAWTWHSISSEFPRQHFCKANLRRSPARLGGRGFQLLWLTAHMQEIFLWVPTYSLPPAASELYPVWFVLSYFDSSLYVYSTFPSTPSCSVRSSYLVLYITCMHRLFLAGVTVLSPSLSTEVSMIKFVTQDYCWKIKDRWTEY